MDFSTFKFKRRLIQAISSIVIILIPFLNILRLDVPTQRFYFLNNVLWVDEFFIIFLIVMIIFWLILVSAMIYGRLWCGYVCPQTTLTEIVNWYKLKIRKMTGFIKNKIIQNIIFYPIYIAGVMSFSIFIGYNILGYFVDPYNLFNELVTGTIGSTTKGMLIGVSIFMFIDIFLLKEVFCIKACPYGMIQVVVSDEKTQIVRYKEERKDECINCNLCVKDCLMNMDIRKAKYQTDCIQCGDCIDACAIAFKKKNKTPLISYSWGEKPWGESSSNVKWYEKLGIVDGKRWAIIGVTLAFIIAVIVLMIVHQPLSMTVSNDRFTLNRTADGVIYNDYLLRLANRSMEDAEFKIVFADESKSKSDNFKIILKDNPIFLKSRENRSIQFSIGYSGKELKSGPNKFFLEMVNVKNPNIKKITEFVFFMP